jgi:hypothetical protein
MLVSYDSLPDHLHKGDTTFVAIKCNLVHPMGRYRQCVCVCIGSTKQALLPFALLERPPETKKREGGKPTWFSSYLLRIITCLLCVVLPNRIHTTHAINWRDSQVVDHE